MEFYDIIKSRQSIRRFTNQPLPDGALERIVQAALFAPARHNRQCAHFIVVDDPIIRQELNENTKDKPYDTAFIDAPAALVVFADPSDSRKIEGKDYYLVETGIAMQYAVLAATTEGLSAHWSIDYTQNTIKTLLNIPREMQVVAMCPIGYATDKPTRASVPETRETHVYTNTWKGPVE